MKYDPLKALDVSLNPLEREIEDGVGLIPIDEADFEQKIQHAAKSTLHKLRGGARQRAGRKSRPHVRTTVLLAPAIRKKLETLAIRDGSLSAAVEKLVQAVSVA
jgi:hypothetical protein